MNDHRPALLDWLACAYGGRGQRAAQSARAAGRLSRSHDLYAGGWHPTAVCGAAGAAHTTARLLQAGGLRAAFGSDGKALQVGLAAAAGVHAARIAAGGAVITADVMGHAAGFAAAFGAERETDGGAAIEENWIKPWPCCLMSHSAVQAAAQAREALAGSDRQIEIAVHPVARRAAAYDDVADGLQAKFSIPYLVAYVVLHGEPQPASFDGVDAHARALARERVRLATDDGLREAEAVLMLDGEEVARVPASRGSPEAPMDAAGLLAKCRMLAGERLDGLLDDPGAPAQDLLGALA